MILLRREVERRGDNRTWRPQERGEEVVEVDMALTRSADHTREDLLGPRAAGRAIPPTDLAIDDGGANGVFGAPVGRLHVGGPQEGEHGRELAVEMGGEALGRRQRRCRVDEPAQANEQAPMSHGEAMIGDRVRITSIAEREGGGEDSLHAGGPRAPSRAPCRRRDLRSWLRNAGCSCRGARTARRGEARLCAGGRKSGSIRVSQRHFGAFRGFSWVI